MKLIGVNIISLLRGSFLWIFVFFGIFSSEAQVRSSVDSTLMRIGEQINYTIQVDADSTQLVIFPQGQSFMPMELVEISATDTLKNKGKLLLTKEFKLTQFDSGRYTIPPQGVLISGKLFETDSITVEVRDIEVDTTKQKLYDIKPKIGVDKGASDWWKWLLLLLLVAGILGFLWYWFFRRKKEVEEKEEEVYLAPYERAKKALAQLDEAKYLERNEIKAYYSELTQIIRTYLDEKVYDHSLESTTQELIDRLKLLRDANKIKIDPATIENLETILRRADLVKFAKSRPEPELAKLDKSTIDVEIDHVKESLPEPSEEEKLEDMKYREELDRKRKRRQNIISISAVALILIAVYIGFSLKYGFRYVADTITGHPTKELLEQKEWVRSEYGAPGITISSPQVLTRTELKLPEFLVDKAEGVKFISGGEIDPYGIIVNSIKLNEEKFKNEEGEFTPLNAVDFSELLLLEFEKNGVQNILDRREKFVTPLGQEGLKTHGTADFPLEPGSDETIYSNYTNLVFASEGLIQSVVIIWNPADPYTEDLINKVIDSVELVVLEEKKEEDAGGN